MPEIRYLAQKPQTDRVFLLFDSLKGFHINVCWNGSSKHLAHGHATDRPRQHFSDAEIAKVVASTQSLLVYFCRFQVQLTFSLFYFFLQVQQLRIELILARVHQVEARLLNLVHETF